MSGNRSGDRGGSLLPGQLPIPTQVGLLVGDSVDKPLPGVGRLSFDRVPRAAEDGPPEVHAEAHHRIVSATTRNGHGQLPPTNRATARAQLWAGHQVFMNSRPLARRPSTHQPR